MKLNQVIALVQGKKARAAKLMTDIHHGWHKDRISGLSRTYAPKDEEGEKFPSESKIVQARVPLILAAAQKELANFFNIVVTQETGNTKATSEIKVDGETLLMDVPVSVLLFLEKQLIDLRTLAINLPTLPTDKTWTWDDAKNCWVSNTERTVKTQKKVEPIVKYDATKEHPAQTDLINVDRTVGHWSTFHLSGALPETVRDKYVENIVKLQDAVKVAREAANSIEIEQEKELGDKVIEYIFNK